MPFPEIPEDLSSLAEEDLNELHDQLVAAFNEATAEDAVIGDEDVATLSSVVEGIETVRLEQGIRAEAAAARAEQLATLASRVNLSVEPEAEETEPEAAEPTTEVTPEAEVAPEAEAEVVAEAEAAVAPEPVLAAAKPKPQAAKSVTAGATVATLKRNSPIKTRPRAEETGFPTITASADVAGVTAGQEVPTMRRVAEMLCERASHIGYSNSTAGSGVQFTDNIPVVRFNLNMPDERKLGNKHSITPEQINERVKSFNRAPDGIQAAGGLCAPVNSYYNQMVIADAARPVRDALANFQADRGGLRYNPPPTLGLITSGVSTVTAAQDASSTSKTCFTVTCPTITEVDVTAVYNCLTFGNFGARAFPEQVEAWTNLALALQARTAEQLLLDGIATASTPVTAAGLVGAGRELFARVGQAAAGFRSRNRMLANTPIDVLLPAWSLDLVQADFARTFTDETGLISMEDADVERLFGARNINPSWYLDSKTGGGQVFGAADSGRTVTDGVFNSDTSLVSATANFTSADVGKAVSGTGIPSGTTISSVTNATTVVLSAATTATGSSKTVRIGAHVLQEFPTTVYAYLFATGSFLHLDAGTLDLGLVRDSTLNAANQFRMFTENFENVALIGPESMEIALNLNADGSYAAARSVTVPILT